MKLLDKNYPIEKNPTWEIVDSTKLQCFMDCPRRYFYEYTLGWRPDIPNNHLAFGSAVHDCMEHILLNGYGPKSISDGFDRFLLEYRKVFPEDTDHLFLPKTPDRFFELLVEYISRYKNDFDRYEVMYTEIAGSVMLSEKHKIYFKMDSVLREKDSNMKHSLEHKTKQGPLNTVWKDDFAMSIQVGTYTHALYCLYPIEEVLGVSINGLGFRKTKRKGEYELERIPIWKTKDQMLVWQSNTMVWLENLENEFHILSKSSESDYILQAFPLNTRNCTKYFGCPYHDFCLAWTNPLQNSYQVPLGFVIDFWNPMDEPCTHEMHLGGESK